MRAEAVSAAFWSLIFTVAVAIVASINTVGVIWMTGLAGAGSILGNPTFQFWCAGVIGAAGVAVFLWWTGRARLAISVAVLQFLPILAWLGWATAHPMN